MEQKIFATTVLGISAAYWSLVLSGKRDLRNGTAKTAAAALGTTADLWMAGSSEPVERRREVWEAYRVTADADG